MARAFLTGLTVAFMPAWWIASAIHAITTH